MTMARCASALTLLLLMLAGGCRPQPMRSPRFVEQSARQVFKEAALVVLGKVVRLKDDTPQPPGEAGDRPIEVKLDVQRVLKGQLASRSACFVYFFPYGGYNGPLPEWVGQGEVGVFALLPGQPCFRVVNDRRAIIRAYNIPGDPSVSLERFVAQAALPVDASCSRNIGSVPRPMTIAWVSFSLVGPRNTRKLLQTFLANPDSKVRTCACLVTAELWNFDEPCMSSLPPDSHVNDLPTRDQGWNQRTRNWLRLYPVNELKTIIDGSGLDGALLDLGALTSRPGQEITRSECRAFSDALSSGVLNDALASGAEFSSPDAERTAMTQFKTWLGLGCPAGYAGLTNPPSDDR